MALLNLGAGLSSMGQGIAQFAGTAAVAQQKADLENQQAILANQLATQRESAGRVQAGEIAATAAGKQQQFETGIEQSRQASAERIAGGQQSTTLQAAGIGAGATLGAARLETEARSADVQAQILANAPALQAQAADALSRANMTDTQTAQAKQMLDISTQLATEAAKPPEQQDPDKIASLTRQRSAIVMDPVASMKMVASFGDLAKTAQQSATTIDGNITKLTTALQSPDMSGDQKGQEAIKKQITTLQAQESAALAQASFFNTAAQAYAPRNAAAPAAGGGTPDLTKYLKPGPGGGSASGPAPGAGLINAPTPGP